MFTGPVKSAGIWEEKEEAEWGPVHIKISVGNRWYQRKDVLRMLDIVPDEQAVEKFDCETALLVPEILPIPRPVFHDEVNFRPNWGGPMFDSEKGHCISLNIVSAE